MQTLGQASQTSQYWYLTLITTIIKNRYSLSYSLNCLHTARYSLDECHLVAAQLNHDYLTDHAHHAASISNTSAETALNNILIVEAAIATF